MHCLVDVAEWEVAMGPGGALEAFVEAKEQGWVRFLGVTGHGTIIPAIHKRSLERFDFDSVQMTPLFVYGNIVSLHVALTAETRHLINAERLAAMKPGAYLINAARGGLVDEAALLDALERRHLHGAGPDVFDPEPPNPDSPLPNRDDVIAMPHIAGAANAAQSRLWHTAITQALQVLRGERPPHLVNPEVWPPLRRQ